MNAYLLIICYYLHQINLIPTPCQATPHPSIRSKPCRFYVPPPTTTIPSLNDTFVQYSNKRSRDRRKPILPPASLNLKHSDPKCYKNYGTSVEASPSQFPKQRIILIKQTDSIV